MVARASISRQSSHKFAGLATVGHTEGSATKKSWGTCSLKLRHGKGAETSDTSHESARTKLVKQLETAVRGGLPAAIKSFVALCLRASSGVSAPVDASFPLPSTGATLSCSV
jgi:hypothetical protein